MNKIFKDQEFYNLLHLLTFKFYTSVNLPTYKTSNDLQLYTVLQQKFKLNLPIKYLFLNKRYLTTTNLQTNEVFLNLFLNMKLLESNSLKNILCYKMTFILLKNKKNCYFFSKKINRNVENSVLSKIFLNLQHILQNLTTEFFYDKFNEFFSSVDII